MCTEANVPGSCSGGRGDFCVYFAAGPLQTLDQSVHLSVVQLPRLYSEWCVCCLVFIVDSMGWVGVCVCVRTYVLDFSMGVCVCVYGVCVCVHVRTGLLYGCVCVCVCVYVLDFSSS